VLRRLARRGHHLEAGVGEQRHGGTAHAPGRTGHQQRPVFGRGAVLDEPLHRHERGQAGQPDDGGVPAAQPVGQRDDPLRWNPGVAGEPAVVRHPQVVALDQHSLAGAELRSGALLHGPGQLHPGHEREHPGHPVPRARDHGVLEVDGAPLDPDEHLAFRKVTLGELDDRGADHLARLRELVRGVAHRLTVEAIVRDPRRTPGARVRSSDRG